MSIEEEYIYNEGKAKRVMKFLSAITVETDDVECPKQRVNNDICYCDRGPGTSKSVATIPHLKTSYCVETESNKAAAADAAANKSSGKTTRDYSRGNKLSPVAKDFGGGNKTPQKLHLDAIKSDDTFMISRESFPRQRGVAEGRKLEKSIFSCVSLPREKMKPCSVIIEELPRDEGIIISDELKTKRKVIPIKEKNISTKNPGLNKSKELITLGKENKTKTSLTSNKIQAVNECEKSRKNIDSSETRIEVKRVTKPKEEKNTPIKISDFDKNKKIIPLKNENKTKTSITPNKIMSNKCQKENENLETEFEV